MKKVAVINDISGFGKCSLTAAIPVLSVLGIQACPVPTAVLTAQSGYLYYHMTDMSDMMSRYQEDWNKLGKRMDGFYSGFLSSDRQYEQILDLYESLKKSDSQFLVDPVMGDHGKKYGIYTDRLRDGMKELLSVATITTPNLTEACLLTGMDFDKVTNYSDKTDFYKAVEEVAWKVAKLKENSSKGKSDDNQINEQSKAINRLEVVITGARFTEDNRQHIANVCFDRNGTGSVYEQEDLGRSYSGTGDLLASCICGYLLKDKSLQEAIEHTSGFLWNSIKEAIEEDIPSNEGVPFENHLLEL